MKLSKLYSNKPDLFGPINFRSGLNVVLAEIRVPENRGKDTHNLGKTTLGRMIDFCFLAKRSADFFLFKHEEVFKDFIFFLEIELSDLSYVTVKRSVSEASRISFKKHDAENQDFTTLSDANWDHRDIAFDRACEMLDGFLDWRSVAPWDFRKGLGFQLRSQDDFQDVFQLRRFVGSHANWKPYVAHIFGFDHTLATQHYDKEFKIEEKEKKAETIRAELGGTVDEIENIDGLLLLKKKDAEKKRKLLDDFDFRQQDKDRTKKIVDEIDTRIAHLNSRRYSLSQSKKKIMTSLEEGQILFNPEEAERLFGEAGVLFSGQIKKDFQQLISFNKAITEERRVYLQEDRAEIESELKTIGTELNSLGKRRSDALGFLSQTDIFAKYKKVTDDLVVLRADIEMLDRQRGFIERLQKMHKDIRTLSKEKAQIQSLIEADVAKQTANSESIFSIIRLYFSEIVEAVLSHKALLKVRVNDHGHLDFKAEILDEAGKTTSAGLGHTYRKLLCIAFDLAVLRAHLANKFPRFVYHDGVFESLDDRKKANLLTVIREYADLGLQPIITLIDSDMPPAENEGDPVFSQEELILTLHDEGIDGLLFRMKSW